MLFKIYDFLSDLDAETSNVEVESIDKEGQVQA